MRVRDAKRQQEYGDPWAAITKAVAVQKEMFLPFTYVDNMAGCSGGTWPRGMHGRSCGRRQRRRSPAISAIRGFQDSALPTVEQRLFSTAPVYKDLEQLQLAQSLTEMQQQLGAEQ